MGEATQHYLQQTFCKRVLKGNARRVSLKNLNWIPFFFFAAQKKWDFFLSVNEIKTEIILLLLTLLKKKTCAATSMTITKCSSNSPKCTRYSIPALSHGQTNGRRERHRDYRHRKKVNPSNNPWQQRKKKKVMMLALFTKLRLSLLCTWSAGNANR